MIIKFLSQILLVGAVTGSGLATSFISPPKTLIQSNITNIVVKQKNNIKYKFTNYGTKQGLGSNNVQAVFANPDGHHVYVGTGSAGVSIGTLANDKWTFKTYTRWMPSYDVEGIFANDDNSMAYAATPWGLAVGINKNGSWTWNQTYDVDNGLPSYNVNTVTGTPDGKTIYVGTSKGLAVGTLLSNGKYKFIVYQKGLASRNIYSLYLNNKTNTIYIGTGGGVSIGTYHGNSLTFINYKKGLASPLIYGIYASENGKYLILGGKTTSSSFNNGGISVGIWTGTKYEFTNYTKDQPFSKMINAVSGTADGKTIYVGSSMPAGNSYNHPGSGYGFSIGTLANNKYTFTSDNVGLSSPFISAISPINNGQTLFIGADFGGLLIGQKEA